MKREELIRDMAAHAAKNKVDIVIMGTERAKKFIGKDNQKALEMLEIAIIEAKKIKKLNEDILLFVKEFNNLETNEINIHTFIKEEIKKFQITYPEEIKFLFNGGPKNIILKANKFLLALALDTILENAVEASASAINFSVWQESEEVFIKISNNGELIPEDMIHKIFQPLRTTKTKGTGLGLFMVEWVVEKHKGNIEVKSGISYSKKEQLNSIEFIIRFPKKFAP
ncbi:MAG: HAMP domain-containing sensor histidine kinase [Patescibacteria group bacterium]|nr:HAMP domain-containing sensor histidine kinase [Patescibacteria group bacterium]